MEAVNTRALETLNTLRVNGTYDPATGLTCYKKVMHVQETRVSYYTLIFINTVSSDKNID